MIICVAACMYLCVLYVCVIDVEHAMHKCREPRDTV